MKTPQVSESEWIVMESLWEKSPQTAAEVAGSLRKKKNWASNTVRTLLSRLVEKGALNTGLNQSGVREFTPAIQREAMVAEESRTFLQRVFQGASKPLLAHFASQSRLSPEEVRELKALLDQSLKEKG